MEKQRDKAAKRLERKHNRQEGTPADESGVDPQEFPVAEDDTGAAG